jgi:hypothetical protein
LLKHFDNLVFEYNQIFLLKPFEMVQMKDLKLKESEAVFRGRVCFDFKNWFGGFTCLERFIFLGGFLVNSL